MTSPARVAPSDNGATFNPPDPNPSETEPTSANSTVNKVVPSAKTSNKNQRLAKPNIFGRLRRFVAYSDLNPQAKVLYAILDETELCRHERLAQIGFAR